MIDWSKEIEAVNKAGEVFKAVIEDGPVLPEDTTYGVRIVGDGKYLHLKQDGTRYHSYLENDWTIRNVVQPIPTRTSLEDRMVAPELVERMIALTRSVSNSPECTLSQTAVARDILAALEPVDPMLLEARQVVADLYTGGNVSHLREQALSGEGDEWFHTKVARAALARGRQLEKEGK